MCIAAFTSAKYLPLCDGEDRKQAHLGEGRPFLPLDISGQINNMAHASVSNRRSPMKANVKPALTIQCYPKARGKRPGEHVDAPLAGELVPQQC